jgi:hypothetical protein
MKKSLLATGDFTKAANALSDESFHGGIHLDICEGISKIDPFIGNHAPVFWMYTFYAHLNAAQMFAVKLFDSHANAVTVPRYVEMASLRASKFAHATEAEVRECVRVVGTRIAKLRPTIEILRKRRNDFIAHISPKLVFNRELLGQEKLVTLPQIREVLLGGGHIVNELLVLWSNTSNQLRDSHSDDYKKVIATVNKHLCDEADRHEAEFKRHGGQFRVPRPKNCP